MGRVSRGKVKFLKRVYAVNQVFRNFSLGKGVDVFAVVGLMGTKRMVSRKYRVQKPIDWKSVNLRPPSLESFQKAGELATHVIDSLKVSHQAQMVLAKGKTPID